jgi:hypothetical protein
MLTVKLICPAGMYVAFVGAVMELTDGPVRSIVIVLVAGEFEAGPFCPVDEPSTALVSNCGVNVPSPHELTVNE